MQRFLLGGFVTFFVVVCGYLICFKLALLQPEVTVMWVGAPLDSAISIFGAGLMGAVTPGKAPWWSRAVMSLVCMLMAAIAVLVVGELILYQTM